MEVEYRDIEGFPGYRVGNDGSVWSCCGRFGWGDGQWRELKQAVHSAGYRVVGLRPHGERRRGGKVRTYFVHRLVLEAFVGPCPTGMQTLHADGNPDNNRLENLRWGTPKENGEDTKRHNKPRWIPR